MDLHGPRVGRTESGPEDWERSKRIPTDLDPPKRTRVGVPTSRGCTTTSTKERKCIKE